MIRKVLLLVLVSLVIQVNCARILAIFPTPCISHQVVFRPITQELARIGHELVVVTTDPAFPNRKVKNLTEIDIGLPSYLIWKQGVLETLSQDSLLSQMKGLYSLLVRVNEQQVKLKEIKDIIKKKLGEFDLLLLEACARSALGFSHVYKVPTILISSLGPVSFTDDSIGLDTHPLLFPSPWFRRTYNLTLWEKLEKVIGHWDFKISYTKMLAQKENEIIKRAFGADTPDLSVIKVLGRESL